MDKVEFDLYVARKFISKRDDAKSRGLAFEMTLTSMRNILKSKKCYYTGFPLTKPTGGNVKMTDLTIERIDCSKGYVPGNVVAACHAANNLKSFVESAGVQGYAMGLKIFQKTLNHIEKGEKK